jgi:hypothetical protein
VCLRGPWQTQYFIANPGSEWTSTNTDWSFFGILYNGVWFLIYLTLLVVPYVPYLRTFAGTTYASSFLYFASRVRALEPTL